MRFFDGVHFSRRRITLFLPPPTCVLCVVCLSLYWAALSLLRSIQTVFGRKRKKAVLTLQREMAPSGAWQEGLHERARRAFVPHGTIRLIVTRVLWHKYKQLFLPLCAVSTLLLPQVAPTDRHVSQQCAIKLPQSNEDSPLAIAKNVWELTANRPKR